jgi:PhnB protein
MPMSLAEASHPTPPAEAIAHGYLTDSPVDLFAADVGEGEEPMSIKGVMFALLGTASPAELTQWFKRLSEGGNVVDDLQRREWGATDGQVIDKFGVFWLIGYED